MAGHQVSMVVPKQCQTALSTAPRIAPFESRQSRQAAIEYGKKLEVDRAGLSIGQVGRIVPSCD